VEGFLSGEEASDVKAGPELTKDIVGYPVIADRGYDSDKFRMYLRGNNNNPVIPGRKNRKEEIAYDRQMYKKRGLIERIFGKVKENRRLAMRYENRMLIFWFTQNSHLQLFHSNFRRIRYRK
jgi:hypothetical protein